MRTLTQKLAAGLRLGRLPEGLRTQLESEGRILYRAEGVLETAIFRHYQAPGVRIGYRRIGFIGYCVFSEHRMVVKARQYHGVNVNVAFADGAFQEMTFAVTPRYLSLAFDASAQSAQASGQIEIRVHLPELAAAAKILEQAGARIG
jgi:prepilin-type processing-associated H-X9-DG protein